MLTLHATRPSRAETIRRHLRNTIVWFCFVALGTFFAPVIGKTLATGYLILWTLAGGQ